MASFIFLFVTNGNYGDGLLKYSDVSNKAVPSDVISQLPICMFAIESKYLLVSFLKFAVSNKTVFLVFTDQFHEKLLERTCFKYKQSVIVEF